MCFRGLGEMVHAVDKQAAARILYGHATNFLQISFKSISHFAWALHSFDYVNELEERLYQILNFIIILAHFVIDSISISSTSCVCQLPTFREVHFSRSWNELNREYAKLP